MKFIVAKWDKDNPLARIPRETPNANQALRDYVAMGATRSLSKLYEKYQALNFENCPSRRMQTLKQWSSKFFWQARLSDQIRIEDEERKAVLGERRLKLAEDDWQTADHLRKVALTLLRLFVDKIDQLKDIKALEVSLPQIIQALRTASDLQSGAVKDINHDETLFGAALDSAIFREFERIFDTRKTGFIDQITGHEADPPGRKTT
jgi:hypothetical protein